MNEDWFEKPPELNECVTEMKTICNIRLQSFQVEMQENYSSFINLEYW